jgi:hypothetical protein
MSNCDKLSDSTASQACLVLSVEGYVRSETPQAENLMQRWFQGQWSPVDGHCSRNQHYAHLIPTIFDSHCANLKRLPPTTEGGHPRKKMMTASLSLAPAVPATGLSVRLAPCRGPRPRFVLISPTLPMLLAWHYCAFGLLPPHRARRLSPRMQVHASKIELLG